MGKKKQPSSIPLDDTRRKFVQGIFNPAERRRTPIKPKPDVYIRDENMRLVLNPERLKI